MKQKRYVYVTSQMVPANQVDLTGARDINSYEINLTYITNLDGVVIGDNVIDLIKRIANMQAPDGAAIVIKIEPRDTSNG